MFEVSAMEHYDLSTITTESSLLLAADIQAGHLILALFSSISSSRRDDIECQQRLELHNLKKMFTNK